MIIKNGTELWYKNEFKIPIRVIVQSIEFENEYANIIININGNEKKFAFEFSFGKMLFLDNIDICYLDDNEIDYSIYNTEIKGNTLAKELVVNYEKNYELNKLLMYGKGNNFDKAKLFLKRRKIEDLYHFTNVKNLESIINHGHLFSVKKLEKKNIDYFSNDKDRFDRHRDCISLSISHPNIFYLNKIKGQNKFCIIEYGHDLLFEAIKKNAVYFVKSNAARNDMRWMIQKDIDYLAYMFSETYSLSNGEERKREKNLELKYPSDEQAELLIDKSISNSFIKRIIFEDEATQRKYKEFLDLNKISNCVDSRFFKTRSVFLNGYKTIF